MKSLISRIEATWGIKKEFRLKVFFLTLAFFTLTACQAIWRPLKSAVFLSIVGVKYIPDAKFLLIFPIILLIIIYSKLVDWLRRHHIFYWFVIFHGGLALIMLYYLSHPVYGIANTMQSPSRIFGWVFYFFMESFGAFMSAVFWSFANSINNPKDSKNHYGLFVSGSKVGGILGAGSMYLLAGYTSLSAATIIPNAFLIGTFLLLCAGLSIYSLMKFVPGYRMHGYEAAYQYEKHKKPEKTSFLNSITQALEGIFAIAKNTYVFGIFTIILSYEVIIVIVDYMVALAATASHSGAKELFFFYATYYLTMHAIGLAIALFGTSPIQRFLGIRVALFVSPLVSIVTLIFIFLFPSANVLFYALVLLRALNYGLNHPAREALFIPTTKVIKFKAKAWTDAFGSRISKGGGSILNKFVLMGFVSRSSMACLIITLIWVPVTYFLGKKYYSAVSKNKVIGAEDKVDA